MPPTKVKTSRVLRDVVDYATHGGAVPLTSRPLASFVPSLSSAKSKNTTSRSGPEDEQGDNTHDASSPAPPPRNESLPLFHPTVITYLKGLRNKEAAVAAVTGSASLPKKKKSASAAGVAASGLVPPLVHKAVMFVITDHSAAAETEEKRDDSRFQMKRFVFRREACRKDVVALAALELGARYQGVVGAAAAKVATLLVIVGTLENARQLATYLLRAYRIGTSVILDGAVKLPTLPPPQTATTTASPESVATAAPCVVVISTPDALIAIDKRSSLWKQLTQIIIDPSSSAPETAFFLTESKKAEYLKVAGALSCVSVAIVASTAKEAADASLGYLIPRRQPREGQRPPASLLAASNRAPFTASILVNEGHQRFSALYALCSNQSKTMRIVVHFATRQAALFVCSAFYAMKFDGGKVFCDSEPSTGGGDDEGAVPERLDQQQQQRLLLAIDDAIPPGEGCVLFSAYGLVPRTGDVFVRYDPMIDIANMPAFIANRLTSSCASRGSFSSSFSSSSPPPHAAAIGASSSQGTPARGAKRGRTPPPSPVLSMSTPVSSRSALPAADASCALLPTAAAAAATEYKHVIVFMLPTEVHHGRPLLCAGASRFNITFAPLQATSVASSSVASVQKLSSLHRKVFAIQQQAYDAFRATAQVYSRLQPKQVYDVTKVNLQKMAEQFGYSEAPLLDLRTKATVFRPKEDFFKLAARRLKHERQAFKRLADATIVGEGPEEDPDIAA